MALYDSNRARSPQAPAQASSRVARYRAILDWLVAVPEWEAPLLAYAKTLEISTGRQGVSAARALRSLPLQYKFEILKLALREGLPTPRYSEAKRIASRFGVSNFQSRSDVARPSRKRWVELAKAARLRLSAQHENYKAAQSSLYESFADLPRRIAAQLCRDTAKQEDACQEARLALLDAIDRINPEQDFAAYAQHWIKRRVRNFLLAQSLPVKAPVNLISKSLRPDGAGDAALAKAVRDGVLRFDGENDLADSVVQEQVEGDSISDFEQRALVSQALQQLTPKQREVVTLRFGLGSNEEPVPCTQIARRIGISRQQVLQREKRALQRLRQELGPLASEWYAGSDQPAIDKSSTPLGVLTA